MRTNIDLDDDLVNEAFKLTGVRTKKELVNMALQELVKTRRRMDWRDLVGKVRFYDGFDPKALGRPRFEPPAGDDPDR